MINLKRAYLIASCTSLGLLSFSTLANAATPGFYVGGQLGWGDTHYNVYAPDAHNKKDSGIAGGVFTGYQFNQYSAVELGYLRFHDASAKYIYNATVTGDATADKYTFKQQAIDVVGKGIIPLQNGLSLYGKAGFAYVDTQRYTTEEYLNQASAYHSYSERKLFPITEIGASYDLSKNASVSAGWTHIYNLYNNLSRSADLSSVSIAYNFD